MLIVCIPAHPTWLILVLYYLYIMHTYISLCISIVSCNWQQVPNNEIKTVLVGFLSEVMRNWCWFELIAYLSTLNEDMRSISNALLNINLWNGIIISYTEQKDGSVHCHTFYNNSNLGAHPILRQPSKTSSACISGISI